MKELQRQASAGIVICLVGNKIDLEEKRAVTPEVSVISFIREDIL